MVTWASTPGRLEVMVTLTSGTRLPEGSATCRGPWGEAAGEEITISVAQECQTINIKIAARILLSRSRLQIDLRTSLRAPSEYPRATHAVFRGELLSEKRTFGIVKRHGEVSRQTDN